MPFSWVFSTSSFISSAVPKLGSIRVQSCGAIGHEFRQNDHLVLGESLEATAFIVYNSHQWCGFGALFSPAFGFWCQKIKLRFQQSCMSHQHVIQPYSKVCHSYMLDAPEPTVGGSCLSPVSVIAIARLSIRTVPSKRFGII